MATRTQLITCLAIAAGISHSLAATAKATPVEWLVSEGGNGHFYEAIAVPGGISWTNASQAANLKGGYLVTITSQAENDFVHHLINNEMYWDGPSGPWIGGYQPEGSPEPAGGWRWVTEEPFLYTNWNDQQPNEFNGNNENRIHFGYIARTPFWNDVPDTAVIEDGRRIWQQRNHHFFCDFLPLCHRPCTWHRAWPLPPRD